MPKVSNKANKVKFGLKNVYFALLENDTAQGPTYGTPVAFPGAVNLSLDPAGEVTKFRADNMDYWVGHANSGYEGTLEMALIIDAFHKDVLGEKVDAKGVKIENADVITQPFALMFEFDGDQHKTRHVLYNCTAGRPTVASQTTEETKEPVTESLDITASPLMNGNVKGSTDSETDQETYEGWFGEVYLPTAATGTGQ